jgi:hypothetical protein
MADFPELAEAEEQALKFALEHEFEMPNLPPETVQAIEKIKSGWVGGGTKVEGAKAPSIPGMIWHQKDGKAHRFTAFECYHRPPV